MSETFAVPRGAILDTWLNEPWNNGVQIDKMPDMQYLHVHTMNNLYEITVIDGKHGDIMVRGGKFFPELTAAHLAGATLGGCFCKMRGIYCGFRMEINGNGQRIITSPVKTIAVFEEFMNPLRPSPPAQSEPLPHSSRACPERSRRDRQGAGSSPDF